MTVSEAVRCALLLVSEKALKPALGRWDLWLFPEQSLGAGFIGRWAALAASRRTHQDAAFHASQRLPPRRGQRWLSVGLFSSLFCHVTNGLHKLPGVSTPGPGYNKSGVNLATPAFSTRSSFLQQPLRLAEKGVVLRQTAPVPPFSLPGRARLQRSGV